MKSRRLIMIVIATSFALFLISQFRFHEELALRDDFRVTAKSAEAEEALRMTQECADRVVDFTAVESAVSQVESKLVVLVVATAEWIEVTENWLSFVARIPGILEKVLVVAESRETCDELNRVHEGKVACCNPIKDLPPPSYATRHKTVMIVRDSVITRLIAKGRNVITSDTDAVWLSDPIPELLALRADQAWSVEPWAAAERFAGWPKFSLCLGFGLVRDTPGSIRLMTRALREIARTSWPGDTRPFLEALQDSGITWENPRRAWVNRTGTWIELIDQSIASRPSRPSEIDRRAKVIHPFSSWSPQGKPAKLAEYGIWNSDIVRH